MPIDPVTAGLVTASLIGSFGANSKARKASRANRRANELEQERRGIQNNIARRKALANARRLKAQVRAEALANGVGLSSGADAADASVDAQTSTAVSTQRQLQEIDQARFAELQKANKFGSQAASLDKLSQGILSLNGVIKAPSSTSVNPINEQLALGNPATQPDFTIDEIF